MLKRIILFSFVMLVGLSILSFAEEKYSQSKVMHIDYGYALGQIGVSWAEENGMGYNDGVIGIEVDRSGNIYLGDYVNGKVKKFSPQGKFLAATTGDLWNIQRFALDRNGNIIVNNDDSGSWLAKFDGNGKLIWSHKFSEVMAGYDRKKLSKDYNIDLDPSFHSRITAGVGDTIIAEISGTDLTTNKVKRLGLKLSANGKLLKVLPVFGIEFNGNLYPDKVLKNTDADDYQVTNYSMDGTNPKHINIKRKVVSLPNGASDNIYMTIPDRRGGIFIVSRILSSETTSATREYTIDRHDIHGNWVSRLQIPIDPFMGGVDSNFTVAPDGSIYFLKADKTGVDIMRYQPEK